MEIDHIPNEKKDSNAVWWVLFIGLFFSWCGYFYFHEFDWWSIALGGATVGILASWAVEMTGNKTPESWRKPPRRNRS